MNLIEELCKDLPESTQRKIKAAYWQGCSDGILFSESTDSKIDRREDNIVYLRNPKTDP